MDDESWMEDLAKRGNLLYGLTGYISILFESIGQYVRNPDFDHVKNRDIYTIAKIMDKHNNILLLKNCDINKSDKIHAFCHPAYFYSNQQVAHNRVDIKKLQVGLAYKFYGSLRNEDNSIIIDIHLILCIENVENCLTTLALTSKVCCQNYYQFYHSDRMKYRISEWWNEVTKKENNVCGSI